MKPLELMRLWSDFQSIVDDPRLSDEQKKMVGEEALRSLPPVMTCYASPNTREAVETLMKKELEKYGKPKAAPKEEQAEVRPGKRKEKDRSNGKQ